MRSSGGTFLVARTAQESFSALTTICTHQTCTISGFDNTNFVCPCHGSRFQRDWINKTWLFRTPYAQPIPLVNHSKNIPAIQTPIAGLYLASMSQVYPWDRGTNFAVEIGRKAAALMNSQLTQTRTQ